MAVNFAFATGECSTVDEFVKAVDKVLTIDMPEEYRWVREYANPGINENLTTDIQTAISEVIWRGKGRGTDKIYIGMKTQIEGTESHIFLNGFAGYDPELQWDDQPGGITKSDINNTYPTIPHKFLNRFRYWISANSQRVVFAIKVSTQYESGYLGLFNPVDSERQYPYPMYIAGSGTKTISWQSTSLRGRGSVCLPTSVEPATNVYTVTYPSQNVGSNFSTARVRRSDGEWRGITSVEGNPLLGRPFAQATLFPYNTGNEKMLALYKHRNDTTTPVNYLLLPILIEENYPHGILGALDGVYFISGTRDIGIEQTLIIGNKRYMVFDTLNLRNPNSYFAMIINDGI